MCGGCKKNLLGKIVHGLVGTAKAVTATDRSDPATMKARRLACMGCEHLGSLMGVKRCNKCKCPISTKTSVASEICPAGKW
jgi:hypothetical protein